MSTRERSNGRAAARGRAAGSLCLVVLVPGAAVGSAHGLATVSSQDTAVPAVPSPVASPARVAPAVSLSRWESAVSLGSRPGISRPLGKVAPVPTSVPPPALGAYHRAAAVLAEAAPDCELDWSLLAAVGHVESDHGERPGSSLGADGTAHPAIVGPAPDAPRGGGSLPDTDGGELDGLTGQDRAVGPMQLLPSVWTAAAVDGDGDGNRDPQDIDDAALAAGVLLCSSAADPSSTDGRRQALRHYNATPGYVDLVERLAAAYATTTPTSNVATPVATSPEAFPASDARGDDPVSGRSPTPTETARTAGTTAPAPLPSRPTTLPTRTATARPGNDPTASPTASPTATSAPAIAPEDEESPGGPGAQPGVDEAPEPTPADPSPEPTPTDPPAPGPGPTPEDDSPEPTPSEEPQSQAVTVTGVWTTNEEGQFLLDDRSVDVEGLGDLTAPAPEDLDGDGLVGTVRDELAGLTGSTLEVAGLAAGPGTITLGSLDDLRRVTASP